MFRLLIGAKFVQFLQVPLLALIKFKVLPLVRVINNLDVLLATLRAAIFARIHTRTVSQSMLFASLITFRMGASVASQIIDFHYMRCISGSVFNLVHDIGSV